MKNKKLKLVLVLLAFAFLLTFAGCKKSYELSYETNGGNPIESVSSKKEGEVELPTPTKDGFEFDGWYLTSDFSGEAVTKVTLNDNITVYAKWNELYKVTLDLNGGSCDKTFVYGKAGQSILSLLEGIKPTKNGVQFGAWFINGTELNASTKLTSKGATVTAKYKAEYVINIFKQNLTLDGYDKTEVKEYAYIDKAVTASQVFEGFTEVSKEDTVDEIVISADKNQNVLNVYYDRDQYSVTFRSNYPVNKEAESVTYDVVYGEDFKLPKVDFACDGYYLLGWSTSKDGEVLYDAHFLDNLAINGEKVDETEVNVKVDRNMSLYAIWNNGYKDMFGGSDYIFKVDDETVYLCRGGIYFVGEFFDNDNSFIFYNTHENIEGKLFDDGTFAFYNVTRDEFSATLYEVGKGLNNDVKVLFDPYNGITYSVKEGKQTSDSKGTYVIDENGFFVATFTEGELAGQTLTMLFGTVTLDNVKTSAFQLRNQEEFEMGELVRFGVYQNSISYYTGAYQMILSGFGTLKYNAGTSVATYYYTYDKETKILNMTNANGQSVGVAKVMEINGKLGYMLYDESLDITYTDENGNTLVLDGLCSVEYTKDGNTVKGYYAITSSAFGGKIITFTANDQVYTFLTNDTLEEVTVGEGEQAKKETITHHNFECKPEGYAEYYYKDKDGTYYAPLIVLNDKEDGKASVYGYTKNRTFELVLEGEYTYDEDGKVYVFNTSLVNEVSEDVLTSPYDITTISGFKFTVDTTSTNYSIHYYHELTIGEEKTTYGTLYTSEDGSTLFVIAGIAILNKDGYVVSGTIKNDASGLTSINTKQGNVYVEIDHEALTFSALEYSPYSAYVVKEDGTYSKKTYVEFDGKGGAEYFYTEQEEVEGEMKDVTKSFKGTISKTEDTTKDGLEIYLFKSSELEIKYITYTTSQATFVFPYYGNYYGTYTSTEDGVLVIDGFTFNATYTDSEGNEYKGIYSVVEENVIRVNVGTMYRYFDISGKTFTARGKEYGTYILMDNQGMPGFYLEFNGYGKLVIYTYDKTETESVRRDIDTDAKYELVDGKFVLTYKDNNKEVKLVGYTGVYTYQSTGYNVFRIEHEEVVTTFVNEKDWTVLKLDSIGNATLHGADGVKVYGTYMLITDTLLYFVNEDSTDANIFTYSMEKGTIIESEFTARGYYTSDLKSLLFSQYGFAIFNNETRYYYTMEGNDVIIYHQDAESSEANKYGFVKEVFGEFSEVKEYNGLTYYANDGYAITFKRVEENKENYPVLVDSKNETYKPLQELTFTPTGTDTFNVSGSVKVDGQNYNCYVVRELVDGEYVMYVSVGYYRFDITATYTGKDSEGNSSSTYDVTGLSYVRSFYPYTFLDTYYLIYSFLGANYASTYTNNLGMIYINTEFDVEGKEVENYAKINFFEGSNIYDLNGESLNKDKVNYTYNETTQLYTVDLEGSDGYTYRLNFALRNHKAFNMYGYSIYALTRVETLKYENFTVEAERVITTDTSLEIGSLYAIKLFDGENELTYSEVFKKDDVWNFVVRTKDDETGVTTTKYYKLALTEKNVGSVEEGDTANTVVPYEKLVVTVLDVTTIYSEDGKSFIDVVSDQVQLICIKGNKYIVDSSTYDAETNTYVVTLPSGRQYKASVDENSNVTIEEIVKENEE